MSDAYRIALTSLDGGPTTVMSSGPFSVIADRPASGGGRGLGFSGGQLLYAAVAACVSNDLYREASTLGIRLTRVALTVDGDFPARGRGSTPITVEVEVDGEAPVSRLAELVAIVDEIAEIPNSMRGTTPVTITARRLFGSDSEAADRTEGGMT